MNSREEVRKLYAHVDNSEAWCLLLGNLVLEEDKGAQVRVRRLSGIAYLSDRSSGYSVEKERWPRNGLYLD